MDNQELERKRREVGNLSKLQRNLTAYPPQVEAWLARMEGWKDRMQPVSVDLLETQVREQKVTDCSLSVVKSFREKPPYPLTLPNFFPVSVISNIGMLIYLGMHRAKTYSIAPFLTFIKSFKIIYLFLSLQSFHAEVHQYKTRVEEFNNPTQVDILRCWVSKLLS